MSLYEELGVDPARRHEEGIEVEIKRRYHHLLLSLHPDRGGCKEDTGRLICVIDAYRVLSDPVLKKEYDDSLDNVLSGDGPSTFSFDWREMVLFMAECIPVSVDWERDVVMQLKDPLHAVSSKLVVVDYTAWRHHVSGSVVMFAMESLTVTFHVDPGVDYATEYLTVEGVGNDVLENGVICRGDVLIEVCV